MTKSRHPSVWACLEIARLRYPDVEMTADRDFLVEGKKVGWAWPAKQSSDFFMRLERS
jgi:hypothetical protein